MAGYEGVFFHSCETGSKNQDGVEFHPVHYDLFEGIQEETVKRSIFSTKAILNCNDKLSNGAWSAVRFFRLKQTRQQAK